MTASSEKIFIVYEADHLTEAATLAASGLQIVCLDFLLEKECKKRNISFTPLRNFVDADTGEEEWWVMSHDVSREWYRVAEMDFFKYKGVRIAEAPEPIMQAYLAKIFYYVRIFITLKKAYPKANFQVSHPKSTNMSSDCLTAFQPWAVLDAARMVGLVQSSEYARTVPARYQFEQATWKSRLTEVYNILIGLLPRHRRKVYMSGYWTHAESLVPLMKDTDIIVLETKKFMEVPWLQRISHRMKFMYPHGPVSGTAENNARRIGDDFMKKWLKAKQGVVRYLGTVRSDLDWSPVLEACEHVVTYSPRVVADIDALFKIMEREKPDLVLQMASVGGPHHYFLLMARAAKHFGIPSMELQHATVTIDPRSVFCRIETDYLMTYGQSINNWHEQIGHDKNRLISVGSPRFDKYVNDRAAGLEKGKQMLRSVGLDPNRPVLLVAVPFSETYASAIDSYQLAEFLSTVREIQRKSPGLQVLFKCRVPKLVRVTTEYLGDLFSNAWAITGEEDIFPFICASDAVICNNSTVIYQAAIVEKPLVLYPWKRFDSYHAQIYAPLIPIAYSAEEAVEAISRIFVDPAYKLKLLADQKEFLKGYIFDGKSSLRTAEIVAKFAENKV